MALEADHCYTLVTTGSCCKSLGESVGRSLSLKYTSCDANYWRGNQAHLILRSTLSSSELPRLVMAGQLANQTLSLSLRQPALIGVLAL